MERIICAKGHFYDGDKYKECPHCAAGAPAIKEDKFSVRHEEITGEKKGEKKAARGKKNLFCRREEKKPRESPELPGYKKTVLLQEVRERESEERQKAVWEEEKWQKEMQKSKQESGQEQKSKQQGEEQDPRQDSESRTDISAVFAKAMQSSQAWDEGKTVGYFGAGRNTEPPVGYLICISGEDTGTGFPLKSGNNSLGRSASMDVIIMDEKVSRSKQAFVMYEPRKREFFVKPGESSGLCYLNDDVVLGPTKMKQFDLIQLGDTKLMLIPVCCDRFSWDDYENES